MNGIPCNITEFNELSGKIQIVLKENLPDYNATEWADIKQVPHNQIDKDIYLLPVSKGTRYDIISKILTKEQKGRIIEVLPGDKNWFPEDI